MFYEFQVPDNLGDIQESKTTFTPPQGRNLSESESMTRGHISGQWTSLTYDTEPF